LGDTVDDAAGEAFDKSAKLLGLGYPGGPALSALASTATPGELQAAAFALPRPKLRSDDLDFSFSGLKTAVLTHVKRGVSEAQKPALAHEVEQAITDVLVGKSVRALQQTGLNRLVISGGVSANRVLREKLARAAADGTDSGAPIEVYFPELALCTDNGAMIAFAAALRLQADPADAADAVGRATSFDIRPRWPLAELS
nr:tRNA (adenosine(37)-N6)-threonylcarbamoyltransferase complex transferase subunit TsaD [Lautropia sp.]